MNNIGIFCLEAECKIWEDQMEGGKDPAEQLFKYSHLQVSN